MNNNETMIEDNDQVYYAVSVKGSISSLKYTTQQGAQDQIQLLSESDQAVAEVVPVTYDGKQILFG